MALVSCRQMKHSSRRCCAPTGLAEIFLHEIQIKTPADAGVFTYMGARLLQLDYHDRTISITDDPFRNASYQQAVKTSAAMAAQNDEVSTILPG